MNGHTLLLEKWGANLQRLTGGEPIDVVIDGAGGDGVKTFTHVLRLGGIIVSYGMTVKPKVDYTMAAVLKNIEIRGSTMVKLFVQCFSLSSRHRSLSPSSVTYLSFGVNIHANQ